MRRGRRRRVRRRARRAPKNDGGSPCTPSVPRGRKSLGSCRDRRGADLHGGARHHDRDRSVALYRRRTVRHRWRWRMGHHQLSCRQRHHPADHRLAVGASRPPQLLPAVDSRVHPCIGAVWNGHQSRPAHPVSRAAGPGRGRSSAEQPRGAAGRLPAREARRSDDAVRLCCPAGAGRGTDPRRLDNGQLFVALGVFHQRPGRSSGVCCVLCGTPRSGLSHEGTCGVEAPAVQF